MQKSMSALGHKRTFRQFSVMSALPPKADICSALVHVCFVPKADIPTSVSLSSVRRLLTQSVTRSQKWSRENSFQQAANYRRGPERQFDR